MFERTNLAQGKWWAATVKKKRQKIRRYEVGYDVAVKFPKIDWKKIDARRIPAVVVKIMLQLMSTVGNVMYMPKNA